MTRIALTETEAESIILEPKRITKDVRWIESREHEGFIKSDVEVEASRGVNLKICLNMSTKLINMFSFALILNNAQRIRGLDFNGSHGNNRTDKRKWHAQTHKHTWTDKCGDSHAYTPNDITASVIEDVFRQFCVECNIDFSGDFQDPPAVQENIEDLL